MRNGLNTLFSGIASTGLAAVAAIGLSASDAQAGTERCINSDRTKAAVFVDRAGRGRDEFALYANAEGLAKGETPIFRSQQVMDADFAIDAMNAFCKDGVVPTHADLSAETGVEMHIETALCRTEQFAAIMQALPRRDQINFAEKDPETGKTITRLESVGRVKLDEVKVSEAMDKFCETGELPARGITGLEFTPE
ncbi:MAG: hypothetical protein ACRBCT_00215 [Alphaproteobacteria bacterium]